MKLRRTALTFIMFIFALLLVACGPSDSNGNGNGNGDGNGNGNGGGEPEDKLESVEWAGLDDVIIAQGDHVNLLEGITVTGNEGTDFSGEVFILNEEDHEEELKDNGWWDEFVPFSQHFAENYRVYYGVKIADDWFEYESKLFQVRLLHNVPNGDFSLDGYNWSLGIPGGSATIEYLNNQANITIAASGSEWWGIQYESNVRFTEGETYKVTVRAKSPQNHSMSFGFEDINDGYAMLGGGIVTHTLTEEFADYTLYFKANNNYANIKAVMYLGWQQQNDTIAAGETHEVVVDSIYIEKVAFNDAVEFEGNELLLLSSGNFELTEEDIKEYVTATLDDEDISADITLNGLVESNVMGRTPFLVQYILEFEDGSIAFANKVFDVRLVRDEPHQIINPDFNSGQAGWVFDINQTAGTGEALLSFTNEGVKIDVSNSSSAHWHQQFFQEGMTFTEGVTYVVSIRVKADREYNANLEAVHAQGGFAPIESTQLQLTEEWQTIEMEVTTAETLAGVRVGFQFGTAPSGTVIEISSINITIK